MIIYYSNFNFTMQLLVLWRESYKSPKLYVYYALIKVYYMEEKWNFDFIHLLFVIFRVFNFYV